MSTDNCCGRKVNNHGYRVLVSRLGLRKESTETAQLWFVVKKNDLTDIGIQVF